ncbi:MAG TPA: DNA ligase D [Vicinamibacterales bacterium]
MSPRRAEYVPQLATLVKTAPEGDDWLHEVKLDGFRMGLIVERGGTRLLSRNGKDWSARYPHVLEAVRDLRLTSGILDGELAMLLPDGRTSFQAMQNAGGGAGTLVFFAFDLLALDGESLVRTPLEERKAALRRAIPENHPVIRYVEHVVGNGPKVFAEACRARLEGIVSKQRRGLPQPGRSREWVKTKCLQRQEVVIGGFTEPQGTRTGIGALLVGVYDGERLVWAGKVGTGFTARSAQALRQRLEAIRQPTSPFSPPPRGKLGREAHWVKPELVAEVAFTEWTTAGKIRHPSFQGLRDDKDPKDVRRERPEQLPRPRARAASRTRAATRTAEVGSERRARGAPGTATARRRTSQRSRSHAMDPVVAGVPITNADRVMYPDEGITKLQLAQYYEAVADWMLPHIVGRPLTLVFCPEGITGPCHYLKHGKAWGPESLRRVRIREKTKTGEYMVVESVQGLVSLMQMNWLEAHTWNSTIDHLERPDRLVFDVDPGPDVEWAQVIEAARRIRALLQQLGLESWVKTTGGRGLHVVVPIKPERGWAETLQFAHAVAAMLEQEAPERYTTDFAKKGRENKLLIDYLRNNRGNTSVAAFSPRARPGATVSTPLGWDELSPRKRPDAWTVVTVPKRLARLKTDPWRGFFDSTQPLPKIPGQGQG